MDAAALRLKGFSPVHSPVWLFVPLCHCLFLQQAWYDHGQNQGLYSQVSAKHAAVLVPLFEDKTGTIRVVLTRRSAALSSHQGEVALPGGKREDCDADDIATALREATEEIALPASAVQVLGVMPPVLSKHFLSVTPVVARIPEGLPLLPNPGEVDCIFDMPLHTFLEDAPTHNHRDISWGSVAQIALGRAPEFAENIPGSRPFTDIWFDGSKVAYRDDL